MKLSYFAHNFCQNAPCTGSRQTYLQATKGLQQQTQTPKHGRRQRGDFCPSWLGIFLFWPFELVKSFYFDHACLQKISVSSLLKNFFLGKIFCRRPCANSVSYKCDVNEEQLCFRLWHHTIFSTGSYQLPVMRLKRLNLRRANLEYIWMNAPWRFNPVIIHSLVSTAACCLCEI